ncbi:hypothetical protein M8C21_031757 [Ambrosia artemisiifolia]|uniref:Protein root UVB sensitive 3 n=1 Tax=Ambrosia artemisiifolia TaxID=4212 RepID=A0AAD5DHE8_AMBAR|nr:hypothetical protein M8C21_031757 [Ambrosia artemisiifolia]
MEEETNNLKSETILEEWSGTSSNKLSLTAVISPSSTLSSFTVTKHGNRFNLFSRRFLEAFVPEGFPNSVTPDYIPFQTWDLLQGLSTYIRMMLSTQALLSAIGVGEKSATVIGATFQGFNGDAWRCHVHILPGMLMDLVSPLFPSAFVFIVCIGSLSRSFTGVASGATRAALTQHFALQNNAADISAKEGSQETVATMIGMALGMLLAHITMEHPTIIWFSFLSLTVFHMYANYKAVRCLNLTTLNCERSSLLLLHFMETGQVFSPKEVSVLEHVLPLWVSSWSSKRTKFLYTQVRLGVRVSSLSSLEMMELLGSAGSQYEKAKYLLLEKKGIISIVMHKDSTTGDVMQGFIHALVMANLSNQNSTSLHLDSQTWMDKHYETFVLKLQTSGWKTERLLSSSITWRANWSRGIPDKKIK